MDIDMMELDDTEIASVRGSDTEGDDSDIESMDEQDEVEQQWVASETTWLDEGVYSEILVPHRKVQITTRHCSVERVKKTYGWPSYIPVPRVSTAYIIDLSAPERTDKHTNIDKLLAKSPSKGHTHFIGCSGYRQNHMGTHRSFTIPHGVNASILEKLINGEPVEGLDRLMKTCSRIVPSRVGKRASGKCKYPHSASGEASEMMKQECSARQTIFIPLDRSIHQVCIVYQLKPHSHPALPMSKPSALASELYRNYIEAVGVVGSTVSSVARAPSTKVILNGKSLDEVVTPPPLHHHH
ncbi:hypothetical protein BDP27DRAFT_1427957 [Rhodocollybia butyracea]|uniref:Uncharacterized protein n=1 Tax=Rhodocollybia butyracea TaxID=206335 RepID=A0A9P5PB98_9AGAR|nr:hypothetical protein BDP27DRAFT_1427957 [Rhodocollybia butyracea]